jgi:hypothetical protein
MDDLQVIRSFRADAPATDPEARRAARDELIARIEARRSRQWPRLAVVLVGLALAAVMAASALALYDFIAGEPAPPDVTELLIEEGTAERLEPLFVGEPNVIAEKAHGVAALETAAGPVLLWAAPTIDGPVCYFVEFARLSEEKGTPQGEANCGPHVGPFVFFLHLATVDDRRVAVVVGWVQENVGSVVLRSPDGTERELELSERFFIAEVPADRVPKHPGDGEPFGIVAKDAGGSELAWRPIIEAFAGSLLHGSPKITGPRRTLIETTDSSGRAMRLMLIPIEGGMTCVVRKTAGGTGGSCGPEPRVGKGIQVHPGLMESIVFLNGSVGPEVATLELHHQDGYVLELPTVERFVFHGIPRARFEEGKRPNLLVARDRDGAEITREKIGQRVFVTQTEAGRGDAIDPSPGRPGRP